MNRYLIVVVACCFIGANAFSQNDNFGFGFRAGASFSRLDGPSELGPNGEELEEYSMARGFHLGAAVSYRFTDQVGMKAEFVFSQRGTLYDYNGPSYYVLGRRNVLNTTIQGTRDQTLNVSNAFIDIPVLVYYKFGSFEILGGFNTGILVASTGGGSTDFNGISQLGSTVAPFEVGLNHNYKKDEAKGASTELINVVVDGRTFTVPEVLMAYFEFDTKNKNLYNTIDLGLIAGAAYYINEGLYLSARYVHGLNDVDQNEYDVSLQYLNPDGSFVQRADKNTSRSWQISIGFSF